MGRTITVGIRTVVEKVHKITGHKALLVPLFQGSWNKTGIHALVDGWSEVKPRDLVASEEIRGEFKEFTILHLPPGRPFERVLLIGAGKRPEFTVDRVRSIAAKAARTLRKIRCPEMTVVPSCFPGIKPECLARAVVEGATLGLHRFEKYSAEAPREEIVPGVVFVTEDRAEAKVLAEAARRGAIVAEAANRTRDLANQPGNKMTPRMLADTARELARSRSVTVKIFTEKELQAMGMGGILAVSQGSAEPPRLIMVEYRGGPRNAPHLALVGKGVTFDSGGISIKPAAAMHQMKYDMSGAAAVLGVVDAVSRLGLPLRLTALAPAAENLPSSRAYKPGDVVRTYSGKWVEILNTDAEGRMLLADALAYAAHLEPDLIVDLATLTGGCVIALGHIASGLMSSNDWLAERILKAGRACQEKIWRLPLYPEYLVQIRSTSGDLVNSGGAPASAITAGMFLRQFVGDVPWAHLDIAGTAWIEEDTTLYIHKPYLPKRGATGVGVRTVVTLIEMILEACQGSRPKLAKLLGTDTAAD